MYLLESINIQLRPELLRQLRPGTRIISHAFNMGDWNADDQIELSGISIYKWVVPAQVAGVWEWEGSDGTPHRIELQQKYQDVTGRAWVADKAVDLKSAKLYGGRLELNIQESKTAPLSSLTLTFKNNELQSIVEEA